MALSAKQSAFIEEYLRCWNATDAYQAIYPKSSRDAARASAARLLANASISEEVQRRVDERAMSANEVLTRLAEHARADYKDFLAVADNGDIALDMDKAEGKTHLIRRVTQRRTIRTTKDTQIDETVLSLELHDAQTALVQIGKHHKLFTDNVQHSGSVEIVKGYRTVTPDDWDESKDDSSL
jgi:phage terminase small subunit